MASVLLPFVDYNLEDTPSQTILPGVSVFRSFREDWQSVCALFQLNDVMSVVFLQV